MRESMREQERLVAEIVGRAVIAEMKRKRRRAALGTTAAALKFFAEQHRNDMSAKAIAEFRDRRTITRHARLRWLSISFALAGITIASSVRLCCQVVSGEANEWDLWLLVAKPAIRQRAITETDHEFSLNRSRLPSSMPPVPCSRTSGQHSWQHWRRYSPVVSKSVMASSGGCFAMSSESTSGHLMPGPRHDAAGRCWSP